MFRTALNIQLRAARCPTLTTRRSFVSTVLLKRKWENESMNSLKREAKKRGLSQSGGKTTLIKRLQEYDEKNAPEPLGGQQTRKESTTTAAPAVTNTTPPPVTTSIAPTTSAATSTVTSPRTTTLPSAAASTATLSSAATATLTPAATTAPAPAATATPAPATPVTPVTETKTEVPGIPIPVEPISPQNEYLNIEIPDLSAAPSEPPVQIPFVFDFWDSSQVNAASEAPKFDEPALPKVLAVAGASTHIGGGPSHNLYDADPRSVAQSAQPTEGGLWHDIAEDLCLPMSISFSNPVVSEDADIPEVTAIPTGQEKSYSRTLDRDEVKGVWLLLSVFAGSWLAAGFFKASSAFTDTHEVKEPETSSDKAASEH